MTPAPVPAVLNPIGVMSPAPVSTPVSAISSPGVMTPAPGSITPTTGNPTLNPSAGQLAQLNVIAQLQAENDNLTQQANLTQIERDKIVANKKQINTLHAQAQAL